jgi:hypothetical protein
VCVLQVARFRGGHELAEKYTATTRPKYCTSAVQAVSCHADFTMNSYMPTDRGSYCFSSKLEGEGGWVSHRVSIETQTPH